jgi:proteasome-associated ATPase
VSQRERQSGPGREHPSEGSEERAHLPELGPDQGSEQDPDALAAELKFLREEVDLLRRRLESAPTRIRVLEERLLETKGKLQAALGQNAKLTETLRAAREQLVEPQGGGRAAGVATPRLRHLHRAGDRGRYGHGDGLRPQARGERRPEVELDELRLGQEVRLNESMNVIASAGSRTGARS